MSDEVNSLESEGTHYSQFDFSDDPKDLSEIPSLDNTLKKGKRKRDTKKDRADSKTIFKAAEKPKTKKSKVKSDPANPKTRGRS